MLFVLAGVLSGCATASRNGGKGGAVELDVMSFNIRNGKANDGENR